MDRVVVNGLEYVRRDEPELGRAWAALETIAELCEREPDAIAAATEAAQIARRTLDRRRRPVVPAAALG